MTNKLIVIVGPTSSGKSDLALKIADKFKNPIINADAFQVYKELNCGTNKLDKQTIKKYDVKLMDCKSIYDDWNIKVFQDEAKALVDKYHKNNLIPIIVGGSNLYVDALIKNYDLSSTSVRNNKYDDLDNDQLYEALYKIDPQQALKNKNNHKKLVRALQIINEIKKTKSEKDVQKDKYYYDCLVIYINVDRQKLYDKINKRVKQMIDYGWKDEVKKLLKKDSDIINLNSFKAIGYKEVYESIINKKSIDYELIAQKTRRYAKRQVTWCKHQYHEFVSLDGNYTKLVEQIEDFLDK